MEPKEAIRVWRWRRRVGMTGFFVSLTCVLAATRIPDPYSLILGFSAVVPMIFFLGNRCWCPNCHHMIGRPAGRARCPSCRIPLAADGDEG